MDAPQMTIGALAAASDVHVETIRYYQRLGLVDEPRRPAGGIRRYDARTVARLRFIRRAQQLGFTLQEVRQLLTLEYGGRCSATRRLAEAKLAQVEVRLADLRRMRRLLKTLIGRCARGRKAPACPIIDALGAD
jgi:MerR family mercuric resistance operon transcriptional regulator